VTKHVTAINHQEQQRRWRRKTQDSSRTTAVKENKYQSNETETRLQAAKQRELPFVTRRSLRCQVTHTGCNQNETESENAAAERTCNAILTTGSAAHDGDKIDYRLIGCRSREIRRYEMEVKLFLFIRDVAFFQSVNYAL